MRLRTLLILIFCNLTWSFHPLMGKWALESFSPTHTAWLRYGCAALSYVIACFFMKKGSPRWVHPRSVKDTLLVLGIGIGPFAISPILQFSGLMHTQSIDSALIVAMEPVFIVFLGWVILREKLSGLQWFSFATAIVGFLLLARFDFRSFSVLDNAQFMGSFLMLIALWGEAIHSIFGRILTQKFDAFRLNGTAHIIGALVLTLYALTREGLPDLRSASAASIFAILWLGPLGSGLNYALWMREVKHAPVATLAITLFIQPVLGAFIGYFFRGESLISYQWLGAVLILTGIAAQARSEIKLIKKLAV